MALLATLAGFRLIFVDEFGVNTKTPRRYGHSLRGTRCVAHNPHGHWHGTTMVAALCLDGIIDFERYTGSMTAERFRNRIAALAEKLHPGDILICDNVAAHKVSGIREILQKKGADIRFPPTYSPKFNPIEKAVSQLKSHIGKVGAKTVEDLHAAVKAAANRVMATHARNQFISCGYEIQTAT